MKYPQRKTNKEIQKVAIFFNVHTYLWMYCPLTGLINIASLRVFEISYKQQVQYHIRKYTTKHSNQKLHMPGNPNNTWNKPRVLIADFHFQIIIFGVAFRVAVKAYNFSPQKIFYLIMKFLTDSSYS